MPDRSESEQKLLRYLDSSAQRGDREAFDAQLLEDDGLFNQLILAEDELIDAFVRGELTDPEAASLQGLFRSSSRVQTKLETTLALGSWRPRDSSPAAQPASSPPSTAVQDAAPHFEASREQTITSGRVSIGWWVAGALAIVMLLLAGFGQAQFRALKAEAANQQQILDDQARQLEELEIQQRRLNLRLSRIEDGATTP